MAKKKKHRPLKVVAEESSKTGPDLPADEFFETRIRPRLKSWGISAIVVIVVAVTLASIRVHASRRQAAGLAALSQAKSYEELTKVARDYPDDPAGTQAALRAARKLLLDGKYAKAVKAFSTFRKDHPGSPLIPVARMGEAYALEGAGKLLEAEKSFLELAKATPGAEMRAEAYVGAARCARSQGKTGEAKRHLDAAISTRSEGYYHEAALQTLAALKAEDAARARKKAADKAAIAAAAPKQAVAGKAKAKADGATAPMKTRSAAGATPKAGTAKTAAAKTGKGKKK